MYDVNNHPQQEELNKAVGKVLADTITKLDYLSKAFNVDKCDLMEQFNGSLEIYIVSNRNPQLTPFELMKKIVRKRILKK